MARLDEDPDSLAGSGWWFHTQQCTFAAEFGRILRTMQEMTHSTPGMIAVSTHQNTNRSYHVRASDVDTDPFGNNTDLDNISLVA